MSSGESISNMGRKIIHVDMDAFFAAIEQRDDPSLRGKPVIVGGTPEGRGVVSAASYEARAYGVHSAMPTVTARRLCPHGVFLPVNGRKYRDVSRQVMAILRDFTPLVEPLSLDEAFLDVTGSEGLFGPAEEIGRAIKRRIREELQLTASVGLAPNKFLAKLASDLKKPDGFVVVPEDGVEAFVRPLPIGRLWGVGKKTEQRLTRLGVRTIGDLAALPVEVLRQRFGAPGEHLHRLAQGLDDSPVEPGGEPKSISAETTFAQDVNDPDMLRSTLLSLSEDVGRRLRAEGFVARTIKLKLRFESFETLTRNLTIADPTDSDTVIFRTAWSLLERHKRPGRKVRLIGVGVSNITRLRQLGLFDAGRKDDRVSEALDHVRTRFGRDAIRRGRLLDSEEP
jgi:DNA polymerase-4